MVYNITITHFNTLQNVLLVIKEDQKEKRPGLLWYCDAWLYPVSTNEELIVHDIRLVMI